MRLIASIRWKYHQAIIFLLEISHITTICSYSPMIMSASTPKYYKSNKISFTSPLLSAGYKPAVEEFSNESRKPILLYLPGFDGTILSPFIQYPELSTVFDVRGMSVVMEDSYLTFDELKDTVKDYVLNVLRSGDDGENRDIYLMGESFGCVLSCGVLEDDQVRDSISGKYHFHIS